MSQGHNYDVAIAETRYTWNIAYQTHWVILRVTPVYDDEYDLWSGVFILEVDSLPGFTWQWCDNHSSASSYSRDIHTNTHFHATVTLTAQINHLRLLVTVQFDDLSSEFPFHLPVTQQDLPLDSPRAGEPAHH